MFPSHDPAEDRFKNLMLSRGNDIVKSTPNQDMHLHIDFYVNGQGVDVKGNKKSNDIWLEIQNVFGGKGWLYGNAEWIVYDLIDLNSFYVYKRIDLLYFVSKIREETNDRYDYLKIYNRERYGGKDRIIRCRESDIKHLLIQKLDYATT